MRIRSRCHQCGRGIDLPRIGGRTPRLCHRCCRRLRLGVLVSAVGSWMASSIRRVWVTVGRRDRVVWERAVSGTGVTAPDTSRAVAPVVDSQGSGQ